MVLNIRSDASYLSKAKAKSRVAGYYFMGSVPKNGQPIPLNGAIYVYSGILKFVVASAAEAELGALFVNCREGKTIRLILEELGHEQPPTPVHCDNSTAVGIANDAVKKHRSRSMEMRFCWVTDQTKILKNFYVVWHPGAENLADYFTKHFCEKHHQHVRGWYLHTTASQRSLPRAAAPSALRGCVGNLPNGYTKSVPLPRLTPAPAGIPLPRLTPAPAGVPASRRTLEPSRLFPKYPVHYPVATRTYARTPDTTWFAHAQPSMVQAY